MQFKASMQHLPFSKYVEFMYILKQMHLLGIFFFTFLEQDI